MAINDVNIHPGMRVIGTDGEEIGRISDVYANAGDTPDSGGSTSQVEVKDRAASYGPSSPEGYRAAGPAGEEMTGEISSTTLPHYYDIQPEDRSVRTVASAMVMCVDVGGVLGMRSTQLSIPFSAVTEVVPNESVTIGYSAAQARDAFAGRSQRGSVDKAGGAHPVD